MRNKAILSTVTALATLLVPAAAHANNPASPQALLGELIVIGLLVGLTSLGGGYALMSGDRKVKHQGLFIGLGVAMVVLSLATEGCAFVFTMVFAFVALARGVQMIVWGYRLKRTKSESPTDQVKAKPLRLVFAGVLLIPTTAIAASMTAAFTGTMMSSPLNERAQEELEKLVAYELRASATYVRETGQARYVAPDAEAYRQGLIVLNDELAGKTAVTLSSSSWKFEFAVPPDGQSFQARAIPQSFPFYPWNHFFSQASYFADQTGQIRAIRVNAPQRCPPDAPVVDKVILDATPAAVTPTP